MFTFFPPIVPALAGEIEQDCLPTQRDVIISRTVELLAKQAVFETGLIVVSQV